MEHKLGKSIIKWTKNTAGVSIARYESLDDTTSGIKEYKYWISIHCDLEGIRGGFQIDSAELKLIGIPGTVTLMNYEKVSLRNYTRSSMVTYSYSQLFDVTKEQLEMLAKKGNCSYFIKVFTSKEGKFSGNGYYNRKMSKGAFEKFIKNISASLICPN
ncbi:MAG: hypothetical protein IPK25_09580 [Saprospiraceae bacterium]|nr:hypothetical protein [Saprospiraceae bacterium]